MKIKYEHDITFSNHDSTHQVTMRSGSYPSSIANLKHLSTYKVVVNEDDPLEPQGVKEHHPICDNKSELDKGS